ncbi:1,4-dihydroxy-2-naphthoate polyprenyltransferase [Rathayibacter iranicus]|uniref:1,4-dihydroxy-2-naphthoate octaprenyltransferase n=1 Tax=Rathayibacter iranicus TaxID=59737 RepID=A0AAD1AGX8_9MICO|nr:1,4-dihydroxy-2-naphthoate polyprenyltransferase [Rathayibacter iranicus]AZZ57070.1 1,4-dihydroxy-2-naphthoate polyprenyltransferase [Rathayibacter iranicus]MWV29694.1 1,4-dihydroxy-2-naphthoate polyprenyltransferase [Rathayibacter iranicus NCPPB 2253 = VKM Ac-1602]PPI41630.1 1,4-dihydroxy-2-naphthoate polyprenyltransferase [Rathayibacter iranicus]PPI57342.1 1,4-dihydroxy-2-naphthoate polyprenyltransferase [Rathayibacter iranicus]PPI68440.1 1,4-dihydroxy-2-naphthoate polyprenyltransferase [
MTPAGPREWIAGARLRTLPLAVAPVLIGTGATQVLDEGWHWVRALLCLAVALALQIAVNFANDYSDGVRGTDANRVGPSRLTGSGAAKPKQVLTVALVFFGLAAVAGLVLTVLSGYWWFLIVGAAAIAAGWFYTGGRRPYGYLGLGDLFVFVFFGLVATVGTTFVQIGRTNQESWLGAVAAGLFACAVLMVNNIRDIPTDRLSGKRTLAVLVGPPVARAIYIGFVLVPFAIAVILALFYPLAWLTLFVLLMILPAILITLTARTGKELVLALQLTSLGGLAYAVILGAALAF